MNVAQIIAEKRNGKALEEKQIEYLVKGYASNEIPDYQMSAFAMAVFFQSMSEDETTDLHTVHAGVRRTATVAFQVRQQSTNTPLAASATRFPFRWHLCWHVVAWSCRWSLDAGLGQLAERWTNLNRFQAIGRRCPTTNSGASSTSVVARLCRPPIL